MADCIHGMPTPASCFECMESGALAPPPREQKPVPTGYTFAAKFPGECRGDCGRPIAVGDRILGISDGTGYVHDGCSP